MNSITLTSNAAAIDAYQSAQATSKAAASNDDPQLRETFESAIGQTLFGQVLHSMRKTVHKGAYMHGGHAEEVFQQQLDQILAEKMSQSSADKFVGPMYDLFTLRQS